MHNGRFTHFYFYHFGSVIHRLSSFQGSSPETFSAGITVVDLVFSRFETCMCILRGFPFLLSKHFFENFAVSRKEVKEYQRESPVPFPSPKVNRRPTMFSWFS